MIKRVNEYKRPSTNAQMVLKRYISNLHQAASFFEEYFINHVVSYHTQEERVDVYFSASNFMHLCGVNYKKGSHAFFMDCLLHQLVLEDILIKKDGTTIQKLQVLGSISEIVGSNVFLTGQGRYLYLEFDHALRTKKQILALTLKDTTQKMVPQLLLDLKRQKSFPKGQPVIAIVATGYQSKEQVYYYCSEQLDVKDLSD